MGLRRVALIFALFVSFSIGAAHAQQSTKGGITSIQQEPLKEWLTYIASDELQGRATYSEGLGLAAGYISSHLAQWGVKPAGDNGTYLQVVKVLGVRTTSRATVTVEVNGQTRTFNDGDGITFPKEMGGKQTVVADRVQFAGYGLTLPSGTHDDYAKIDPGGKCPAARSSSGWALQVPRRSESGLFRLLSSYARNRAAIAKGAIATIAPPGLGFGGRGRGDRASGRKRARHSSRTSGRGFADAAEAGQWTMAISRPLSGSTARSRRRSQPKTRSSSSSSADRRSSTPSSRRRRPSRNRCRRFALKGVKITFNVDADYTIVRTRLTHNVVGIVEGSDPKLKDTYVAYGAHYDHIGYREGAVGAGRGGQPSQSRGSDQQRRRRRRIGDGGDHGDRARVRAGPAAEALAALRLAYR